MSQPRNPNIPNQIVVPKEGFITWEAGNADSIKSAQTAVAKAYDSIQPIVRSSASDSFSVRHGMDRDNYEIFRPGESIPRIRPEVLSACAEAYKRVSPIKNIIDMMVDFTTEGIKLVHTSPGVQELYQNWWNHIDGLGRSQHFMHNFYLFGTAIAKRNIAKLSARVVEDLERGLAAADYDFTPEPKTRTLKYVVPWSYDFLNPQVVKVVGGELAMFAGKQRYGFDIPAKLISMIRSPKNPEEREMANTLPAYITDVVKAGGKTVVFDDSRLVVSHNKKMDWQEWADPILLSVMDDIILLQKMKLTDLAALDGAISHIRIWKLGSIEHRLMPTEAAFQKLNDVLMYAGNGQSFDLIWGPDLTLEETSSDIHKYLGQEKYVSVYSSIFSGLGVPPTLVGGAGGEKGFTNNFLSMKTLIERLNTGRAALTRFWNNEVRLVQQGLQLRNPAHVEFKNAVLTDEASFNSMLIDLLDRDVISVDRVREHLGYIPEIEEALVKYEWKSRASGRIPPKAGPFHEAEQDHALEKIFATSGVVTPSQVGLDLPEPKPSEKNALQMRSELKPSVNTPDRKGQQGQGRPRNSKDTSPRKTRRIVPRTAASQSEFFNLFMWAKEAQQSIAEILHPIFLQTCDKKNMRTLTVAETEEIEHLKFLVLCNTDPFTEIDNQYLAKLMQNPLPSHPEADNFWKVLVATFVERSGSQPTIEDIRQIQNYVYALYKGEYDASDSSDL